MTLTVTASAVEDPGAAPVRGWLRASPGQLAFTSRASEPVVHIAPAIAVSTARLRAPWANTYALVQGSGACLRVTVGWQARGRLCRMLRGAGLVVQMHSTWRRRPGPRAPAP